MKRKISIVTILIFLFACNICQSAIRYITVSGNGLLNGTTWSNAFPGTSLQTAINSSAPGDEVWVAAGTYFTTNTANRNIYFNMLNGVAVYGSFNGTETTLSQRNFVCGFSSFLSAEIGAPGIADNSYHVINNSSLNNTALLDGFTITGANANFDLLGNDNRSLGGGILNNAAGGGLCSPTIRNCLFTGNSALFGGGIFNHGQNGGNANPAITNCIFAFNTATSGGGGIDNFGYNGNASPVITNSIFYNNIALSRAGAMYCWGGGNGNASPVVLNSVFVNNSSVDGGGIVSDRKNFVSGNSGTANPTIRNSIFWGNTASGTGPQFYILGAANFTATFSAIDISNQNVPHTISGPGTGNIFTAPVFMNIADADGADNCWLTFDDGLQLQTGSVGIDAGNNTSVPLFDIRNYNRIGNAVVDMGAYEFQSINLNLKMFLQGYYTGAGTMQPVLNNHAVPLSTPLQTDTISLALHHPTTYALIDSRKAVLQTNGTILVNFIQPDGQYHIVIRHRNTVQTWSSLPLFCSASTPLYDFSTGANKAFGNNQIEVEPNVWAFYTGDLNQDDFIDGNDFPAFDTDSFNGVNSIYVATDMNGDGFVDGNDFPVFDVNSFNGVSSLHP